MTPIQRYELIRPILEGEKTVAQVHNETKVPVRTLYRYLKRFGQGEDPLESLSDKSHAAHSHPKWFTQAQKEQVITYKLAHSEKSANQIADELTETGRLPITGRSVANILKQHSVSHPPFLTNLPNSLA